MGVGKVTGSETEPVTVLHEQWELWVYRLSSADRPVHLFDLALTQTTATDSALALPQYRYGGVGFRGRGGPLFHVRQGFLRGQNDEENC